MTSRMNWYYALAGQLLDKDNIVCGQKPLETVLESLEETVITLYQALLLYQMKSVCSYYRNRFSGFLHALANMDDWDGELKNILDAESKVQADSMQYTQQHARNSLVSLADSAKEMKARLGDLHQDLQDLILMQKAQMDDKDTQCLRDLCVEDPRDVMEYVESSKDELLHDAFRWILLTSHYVALTSWSNDQAPSCRMLWVNGPAGTGKTMLMIGIIRELTSRPVMLTPGVAQFFFQGTNGARNSATAALRSLLWLLLVQQPHLIHHLQKRYKYSGSSLFVGDTAFIALSDVFRNILKDPSLSPTYLIVDALDECTEGRDDFIGLISTSLSCSRVKWLISSRPEAELNSSNVTFSLALDSQNLQGPVNSYIDHKLLALRNKRGYTDDVIEQIGTQVRQRAMNIFLWVALAFKQLAGVNGWSAVEKIKTMPKGLSELYDAIMAKVKELDDWPYCKLVLATTSLAYRPLSLSELSVLSGLPIHVPVRDIVEECGSFYTIKDDIVSLIHQSAKDYLGRHYDEVQPDGIDQGHINIVDQSLQAISTLRENIYSLQDYGFRSDQPDDVLLPDPDPLSPLQYSCLFWPVHLCLTSGSPECGKHLADDGPVFEFLKQHLLHWLESLSLLGRLPSGIVSIQHLLRLPQVCKLTAPF